MSHQRLFSKKELGMDARKRSAYDIEGATRDVKRRQQPKPATTGVSGTSAFRSQRPPDRTALGASGTGVSGGPRAASGGPWGLYSASSNPLRKHPPLNRLLSSTRELPNVSTVPIHVGNLSSAAHQPPKKASTLVEYGFKPADRTTGVLDDESSNDDEHDESGDSSEDDSDETGGGRHPLDSTGTEKEEGIESSGGSPNESSEDSKSEIYGSSEDDNDGDSDNPPRDFSAEENGPGAPSLFREISETLSGKPYNMFRNEDGTLDRVNGALIPDGYRLQHLASFPEYRFICPVRDCRKLFSRRVGLVRHFIAAHSRCHFIDNLDKDATLTVHRRVGKGRSIVVSQWPLDDSAPALKSPSLPSEQRSAEVKSTADIEDINDPGYYPTSLTEPRNKAAPIRQQSKRSTLTKPGASGSANAKAAQSFGSTTPGLFAVKVADIRSEAWTYIKPFVNLRWLALFQNKHERSAFLQIITLPKRNEVDKAWVEGIRKSHPKGFRSLISLVFHVVGVMATCSRCKRRSMERMRICMILPPEAKDMRELQEAVGSQCVNCFLFPGAHPCEFATSGFTSINTSTRVKQTPIPTPLPARVPKSASRPSSYIATGLLKPTPSQPILYSPIPVPVLPLSPQTSQAQAPQAHSPADGSDGGPVRRSGLRSAREPDVEIYSHGDSVEDSGDLTLGLVYSDDVTSNDEPVSAKAKTVASTSVSGTPPRSSTVVSKAFTLFGEITQLPAHEQDKVYGKIAAMLEVSSGALTTTRTAAPGKTQGSVSYQYQGPAADGWEIAPGRLTSGGEPVAFSTSSLRRKAVSLGSAQYITPTEKVLNKHIRALDHLKIKPEADWDCKFSVTKGMVKVKMGDVEANIGYGGVLLVKHECIVTNAWHDESHIQVWWKQVDE